jgi:ATPase subunit of ABC transporter with duplicated ATPase domains
MPQEPDAREDETLMGHLARRTGVAAAEAALEEATARLGEGEAAIAGHSDALERFLRLGGDDLPARAAAAVAEVGIPRDRLDVPMTALSGGQAARATLAVLLLARVDVLLLDEPTNNLDFAGLDLLERFVSDTRAAVVVVSHDRAFLDRCATRIVEIVEPDHTVRAFAGGWTDFVRQRDEARARQSAAHGAFVSERDRLQDRMRRQRAWSEQGVRGERRAPRDNDRVGRGARIERSEQQAAKVRATERAIARLESVDKPWEAWELRMAIDAGDLGSEVVARLEAAVVVRGAFRLGPVDLEVRRGDRIAITGPNGSGKSTLLGALLGRLPLASGTRHLGPSVRVGELSQDRAALASETPLLETLAADTGMRPEDLRSLLAKFALDADAVTRPASRLSPGQRTRAGLASLVALRPNCIVLDEPTNHLDLEAIEQLEGALEDYAGTILLVSHDRRMLENLRVAGRIALDGGRVRVAPA